MIDLGSLLALGRGSRLRVGIGLSEAVFNATAAGLRRSGCRIELERHDSPRDMVESLRSGRLDAAVRGTLVSSSVLLELKRSFGVKEVMRAAILVSDRPFILAPVGIDEGVDAVSRLRLAEAALRYFSDIGWRLRVGVLSKGRLEDRSRGADIEMSIEQGEMIAKELRGRGFDATHRGILIEDAIVDCDFILAPDGTSGNLIFRTMHFLCGAEAYGAPVVNIDAAFVDTSRAKEDFCEPVMLAGGLAEHRRTLVRRA